MARYCSFVFLVLAFGASVLLLFVALGWFWIDTVDLRATTSYALVDCPPPPPSSTAANSSGFRDSVLPLLATLPAAAAAEPFGSASLQSDDDRAFVRGLCLGFFLDKECRACLHTAAKNLTDGCLRVSRRGGAWRSEGCFLAYADSNTTSAREDAFRKVVLSREDPGEDPNCFDTRKLVALAQSMGRHHDATVLGVEVSTDAGALAKRATAEHTVRVFPDVAKTKTTVSVQAQCPWGTAAAECARCLGESARRVPPCSWDLDGAHVRVADVLGYGCYLRIETSVPPQHAVTWPNKRVATGLCVLLLLALLAAAGVAFRFGGTHSIWDPPVSDPKSADFGPDKVRESTPLNNM